MQRVPNTPPELPDPGRNTAACRVVHTARGPVRINVGPGLSDAEAAELATALYDAVQAYLDAQDPAQPPDTGPGGQHA